jgi:hypothetical protein
MTQYRNVLRDTNQNGYPIDLERMLASAKDLVPMAQALLERFPTQCQSTLETFYQSGLYFHLDETNPNKDEIQAVHQTLAMWAASLVRFVSSVTIVRFDWIFSQGSDFSLEDYAAANIPPDCGVLCLTKPPKWDTNNKLALFADKLLWGRRNKPAFATLVVGSLDKYPHQIPLFTVDDNNFDNITLDNYDPTTGFRRRPTTSKTPKHRQ